MRIPSTRQLFILALLGCIGLLAFALYLEHVVGLVPCPLCHVQRVAVLMFAVVCLLATVHNPALCGQRVYAVLAALAASFASLPQVDKYGCKVYQKINYPLACHRLSSC